MPPNFKWLDEHTVHLMTIGVHSIRDFAAVAAILAAIKGDCGAENERLDPARSWKTMSRRSWTATRAIQGQALHREPLHALHFKTRGTDMMCKLKWVSPNQIYLFGSSVAVDRLHTVGENVLPHNGRACRAGRRYGSGRVGSSRRFLKTEIARK